MILRYFLVTLGLFLGLTACSGGTDTPVDDTKPTGDDDDDDDDDDSGDSGGPVGNDFIELTFLMVDASFAWDSQTQQVVSLSTDYGDVPSTINIYLGDDAWEAAGFEFSSDAYCTIALPLTQGIPATWIATAGIWFGIDYRTEDAPFTNCNTPERPLDPALGSAPELAFASYNWGVGVGELWPEYVPDYSTSTGTLADAVLGGYINNSLINDADGFGQTGYIAAGRQINASYELIVGADGNAVLLPAASINLGNNNIATGHYLVIPRLIWVFN